MPFELRCISLPNLFQIHRIVRLEQHVRVVDGVAKLLGHIPRIPAASERLDHTRAAHIAELALADRPPSGPGWLHEIKFDGYRVIARKDGERVRLWARTTSDYSNNFTRIRDAVAALLVESAVLDGLSATVSET